MRYQATWLPTLLMQCRKKQEEMSFWYAIYQQKTWSIKQAVSSHFKGRSVSMTFVIVKLLSLCWSTLVFPVLELPGKGGWVMPHRPSWCLLPLLSAGSGFRALSVPEESHMQYSRANIWLGGLWNKWTHLILQYPCCTSRSGCCGVQQDKFPDLSEPWIQLL